MSNRSVTVTFQALPLRYELQRILEQKIGGLKSDRELSDDLHRDLYDSIFKYLPHDTNALRTGQTFTKSPQEVRHGQISITSKGLVINPYSVYTPKIKLEGGGKYYYGAAVLDDRLDTILSESHEAFVERAANTVKARAKKL